MHVDESSGHRLLLIYDIVYDQLEARMEHTRIQLPGFGLPLNCYHIKHEDYDAFPSTLNQIDVDENRTM